MGSLSYLVQMTDAGSVPRSTTTYQEANRSAVGFFLVDRRLMPKQIAADGLALQCSTMFAARPFALNTAPAILAGLAARATITKTTTIKG